MAVFKAYVDDSGDTNDPKHSACSIAGFVGTVQNWMEFENRWEGLLEKFRIPWLHMRDFAHHRPPFDRLSKVERSEVLGSLIDTIKHCELVGYGGVIRLPDLRRFNRERSRELEARPLALYACMNDIYVADPWREIDMTLDRFDKPQRVINKAREYAASHWSDDVSQTITSRPLGGSQSFRNVLPIQAADFLPRLRTQKEPRRPA